MLTFIYLCNFSCFHFALKISSKNKENSFVVTYLADQEIFPNFHNSSVKSSISNQVNNIKCFSLSFITLFIIKYFYIVYYFYLCLVIFWFFKASLFTTSLSLLKFRGAVFTLPISKSPPSEFIQSANTGHQLHIYELRYYFLYLSEYICFSLHQQTSCSVYYEMYCCIH